MKFTKITCCVLAALFYSYWLFADATGSVPGNSSPTVDIIGIIITAAGLTVISFLGIAGMAWITDFLTGRKSGQFR